MTCKGLIAPGGNELGGTGVGDGWGRGRAPPSPRLSHTCPPKGREWGSFPGGGPSLAYEALYPTLSLFTECLLPSPLMFSLTILLGSGQRAPPAGSQPPTASPHPIHVQQHASSLLVAHMRVSSALLCPWHRTQPRGTHAGTVTEAAPHGSSLGHVPTPPLKA